MASSSIREMTGCEIPTVDIHNPPKMASAVAMLVYQNCEMETMLVYLAIVMCKLSFVPRNVHSC